ncbi:MAG: ABC transporter permease [Candidatus Limnocylindria bacterium]
MTEEPLIDWGWVAANLDLIGEQLTEHLLLTAIAIVVGAAISFGLALLIYERRWLREPIVQVTGIIYTIPSLALFAFLVPYTGLSLLTAETGLVGYTLLILIRNIIAGLDGVPDEVREAAEGMGYSNWGRLWAVELPLALPVIVAGFRVATVTTIGLVTVTALIGQGGLGQLMVTGLLRPGIFETMIYVGAVLSVALAVVADVGLLALQRALTPWARSHG